MPYKDKEKRREYLNEYKRRKRRERGLQKQGRKSYTEEEKAQAKSQRSNWEKEWRPEYFSYKPEKRLIWAARKRAKEKGLEFDIEESDIHVPTHCPYLNIELVPHVPRGNKRDQCMSLDRVDNSKGYIKGNVEVISHLANSMKNSASQEQLILFAKEILKRTTH